MKITFSEKELLTQERSLISEGRKQRLREKEFSVLKFLCNKYPLPATTEDLQNEVWGGRYVSPHCIAQVIWSLRLILGDKDRSIITTIPKLGYKLDVEPEFSCPNLPASHSNMSTGSTPVTAFPRNISLQTQRSSLTFFLRSIAIR